MERGREDVAAGCCSGRGWDAGREKGCPGKNEIFEEKPPFDCGSRIRAQAKLEENLRSETVKWQGKAQDLHRRVSGDSEFLENVSAYIRDCQYFLDKNDLIRAFEAIIWAWAWMEIGLQKGVLKRKD
ncbi:MAG: DUF357 domain-containing protein [Methanothrix sp.]|nr:DUF357 domain-containing protein [Methanothrix sp.]